MITAFRKSLPLSFIGNSPSEEGTQQGDRATTQKLVDQQKEED